MDSEMFITAQRNLAKTAIGERLILCDFRQPQHRTFRKRICSAEGPVRDLNGSWKKLFNSDAAIYCGHGVGNGGASIVSRDGRIEARIPANGFVVLSREV
jgi:hypothetical protein